MTEIAAVLAEIARLRAMFLADLPRMLKSIEDDLALTLADLEFVDLEPLIRQVHSLAGTSETFGLEDIGHAARCLESLLVEIVSVSPAACIAAFGKLEKECVISSQSRE